MDSKTIVMCVVALLIGMLLANMLKNVCGCKVVEGQTGLVNECPSSSCRVGDTDISPCMVSDYWMTQEDKVGRCKGDNFKTGCSCDPA